MAREHNVIQQQDRPQKPATCLIPALQIIQPASHLPTETCNLPYNKPATCPTETSNLPTEPLT